MEFDFGTTNVVRGVNKDEGDDGVKEDADVRRKAEECTPLRPVETERGRVCCGRSVVVEGERRGGREFEVCPTTSTVDLVSGWLAALCRDMGVRQSRLEYESSRKSSQEKRSRFSPVSL